MIDELEALSAEYETATRERSWEIYNRLLEIGAGMGSDGYWRMRDAEWILARTSATSGNANINSIRETR